MPRSSASSATAGVGSTPAEHRVPAGRDDPAANASSSSGAGAARVAADEDAPAAAPERGRLAELLDELDGQVLAHDAANTVGAEVAPHAGTLTLGELRRFAGFVQAGLLALDLARVAREEPSRLSGTRRLGSASTSARAIPCRTAPACPLGPPPVTRTRRSNVPSTPATLNGASAAIRWVWRGKYSSIVRPLIQVAPSPGRRITRATEVLRLPVPRYWAGRCSSQPFESSSGSGSGACASCGCFGPA